MFGGVHSKPGRIKGRAFNFISLRVGRRRAVGDGRRSSTTLLSSIFNFNEVSTEIRLTAYWESKSGRRWQDKDTFFSPKSQSQIEN
eukprot:scaffold1949_cov204-Alexandrium_tamarense.AAC.4